MDNAGDPRLQGILSARHDFLRAESQLEEAVERFLRDDTGDREDCLLAFLEQGEAYHVYTRRILTCVSNLWRALEQREGKGNQS